MEAPAPIPSPAEGRRSRRRRELHQAILGTAAGLFARDGYEATTVERIAAAADIAPATFFNHFPAKEDVLRELGQDVLGRFARLVEEQAGRSVGTAARLEGFARRSATLVDRAPAMTRRMLVAVLRASRPGEGADELAAMQACFRHLLELGRSGSDDVPADVPADLDLDLVAELLVSTVTGAMTRWINDPAYPLGRRLGDTLGLLASRLLAPGAASKPATASRRATSPPAATTATGAGTPVLPRTRPGGATSTVAANPRRKR